MAKVNRAFIPGSPLESELFGYEEGALTGTRKGGRLGKFELANKGAILLDETGGMSLTIQSKLPHAFRGKELEWMGGAKITKLDAWAVVAANRNLEKMMERDEFRSDLYYRLYVMSIHIPSLRSRREDVVPLVRYFIARNGGDKNMDLTPGSIRVLEGCDWPGNMRELQNVIRYAMVVKTGNMLEIRDFPQYLREDECPDEQGDEYPRKLRDAVEGLGKSMIKNSLKRGNENKNMAIDEFDLSRRSLYEKMEKHGLK